MKGTVEIEIPQSCLLCPLFKNVDSVGWTQYMKCAALNDEVEILDKSSKNEDEWESLDYCNKRYWGCPIKKIEKEYKTCPDDYSFETGM